MCAAVLLDLSAQIYGASFELRVPCWPPFLLPHDQFLQVLYGGKNETKILSELAEKETSRSIIISSIDHAGELLLAAIDCLVAYLEKHLDLKLNKQIFQDLFLRMNVLVNFLRWTGVRFSNLMKYYGHYWFVQTVKKSPALVYLDPKKQLMLSTIHGMKGYRGKLQLLGKMSEPKQAYHKYIHDAHAAYCQREENQNEAQ